MAEPKGGEEGHLPPWLLLKFSNISSLKQLLTDMEEKKKKKKKGLLLGWKWLWHKKKKWKKSSQAPNHALVLSYVKLAPISIFLFYIIIYTIFTIYDTFYSILFLNDARYITNFTTYVLQIGMSPITKNHFKHLFIIFFK